MTHVLSAVAWPYANGPRHIGHVAGFGVPSDVFSRYMRMAGHDVLMVSGTDEHGTPILVTADKEGVSAKDLADKNNAVIVADLVDLGLSYDLFTRTTTGNHYRVVQEMFRTCHRNGYMVEQTTQRRDQPVDRPHAARPLHRGHLPDLRLRRGARRPVRQLRQPARRHRPDRPALEDQRRDARVRRDPALLPRPAGAGRRAGGVARRARGVGHLAPQRHQVLPEHPRGDPAARDEPRHRLGHPGPGLGGPADQAALRLVRRRHRLPLRVHRVGAPARRARPLARLVERPERACPTTSWARTTSSSTPRSGRPSCSPTHGKGDRGGEPGEYGELNLPTEVVSSEYLTMGDAQFSTSRGHVLYVGDFLARYGPDPLRYFICAAGPETSDAAFTWAEFVTRNNSELVAGWGNLVNRTATMIAKNFGEIPPCGDLEPVDEAVLAAVRDGLRHGRRPDRPAPAPGRHRRGDAGRRRGEQVPHRHRALQDEGRRRSASGWRPCCTSRRSA